MWNIFISWRNFNDIDYLQSWKELPEDRPWSFVLCSSVAGGNLLPICDLMIFDQRFSPLQYDRTAATQRLPAEPRLSHRWLYWASIPIRVRPGMGALSEQGLLLQLLQDEAFHHPRCLPDGVWRVTFDFQSQVRYYLAIENTTWKDQLCSAA